MKVDGNHLRAGQNVILDGDKCQIISACRKGEYVVVRAANNEDGNEIQRQCRLSSKFDMF